MDKGKIACGEIYTFLAVPVEKRVIVYNRSRSIMSASDETLARLKALNAPLMDPALPIPSALAEIRSVVLLKGLPDPEEDELNAYRTYQCATFRGRVWKVLLGACEIPCEVRVRFSR